MAADMTSAAPEISSPVGIVAGGGAMQDTPRIKTDA
jgi:hypothetical protein